MGIEGAVRLGLRSELEAIADPAAREQLVKDTSPTAYARGKAISMASYVELDGVIDPADTRSWIARGATSTPVPPRAPGFVDPW